MLSPNPAIATRRAFEAVVGHVGRECDVAIGESTRRYAQRSWPRTRWRRGLPESRQAQGGGQLGLDQAVEYTHEPLEVIHPQPEPGRLIVDISSPRPIARFAACSRRNSRTPADVGPNEHQTAGAPMLEANPRLSEGSRPRELLPKVDSPRSCLEPGQGLARKRTELRADSTDDVAGELERVNPNALGPHHLFDEAEQRGAIHDRAVARSGVVSPQRQCTQDSLVDERKHGMPFAQRKGTGGLLSTGRSPARPIHSVRRQRESGRQRPPRLSGDSFRLPWSTGTTGNEGSSDSRLDKPSCSSMKERRSARTWPRS